MPEAPQITKLELLIKEKSDEFSANEKIIADYFIRNESTILSVSVPQISKECSVSKATVVRFCKRLGFSGLKDFKIFYQTGKMDVGKFTGPVCWTDSDQVAFYKVFTSAISALQQTFRRISWEDLSQAAGLIAKATNIDAYEFIRLGKRVNAHTDIYTIRHFSQEFKKDDLVIFFSRSGENLTQLASRAKASGCTVMAVTCEEDSTLARIADKAIVTSEILYMENDRNSYSRIAEISVISVLFLMSALNMGRNSSEFIEHYSDTTNYEKL